MRAGHNQPFLHPIVNQLLNFWKGQGASGTHRSMAGQRRQALAAPASPETMRCPTRSNRRVNPAPRRPHRLCQVQPAPRESLRPSRQTVQSGGRVSPDHQPLEQQRALRRRQLDRLRNQKRLRGDIPVLPSSPKPLKEDTLVRRMLIDHLQFFAHLRHEIGPEDLSERYDLGLLCRPIRRTLPRAARAN